MTTPTWRAHLSESERTELIDIDAEIAIARESDRRHTAMREKIRRRCVARVRLAEVKRLREGKS